MLTFLWQMIHEINLKQKISRHCPFKTRSVDFALPDVLPLPVPENSWKQWNYRKPQHSENNPITLTKKIATFSEKISQTPIRFALYWTTLYLNISHLILRDCVNFELTWGSNANTIHYIDIWGTLGSNMVASNRFFLGFFRPHILLGWFINLRG